MGVALGPTGNARWPRLIGIVGGLGPRAHVEFEKRLLDCARRRLGPDAVEQEYPSWLLASMPAIPDRTKAIVDGGASPAAGIVEALGLLKGADFAVIPCMTAHAFIDEIAAGSPVPLLNLIEETLAVAAARLPLAQVAGEVGLLATNGTLRAAVFHKSAAARADIRLVTPEDLDSRRGQHWQQSVVMGAIYGRDAGREDLGGGVKGGSHEVPEIRGRMTAELESLLGEYAARGVRVAIAGCTELSILAPALRSDVEIVDPLAVGAEAVLDLAEGVRPLPAAMPRLAETLLAPGPTPAGAITLAATSPAPPPLAPS